MHTIVVTRDSRVLLTERSPKVDCQPGTWSCSVEEQLAPQDFPPGVDHAALHWCRRLLWEELGLGHGAYREENLRILSVFLQQDVLNISHVELEITASELHHMLQRLPRMDYELSDWKFLPYEELMDELLRPTRVYHPTSGYRMLMALIHRHGEPRIIEQFGPPPTRPSLRNAPR